MDDLDALLDDLHTTSQQYHHAPGPGTHNTPGHAHFQTQSPAHHDNINHNQPLYEPTNILNNTTVIETTVYKTPPPSHRNSQSERYQTPPSSHTMNQSSEHYRTPPPSYREVFYSQSEVEMRQGAGPRASESDGTRISLKSNLSELDNMLEDLNSAQFLSEVDKKSRETHSPYANVPPRPALAPKPVNPRDHAPRGGVNTEHVNRIMGGQPPHHVTANDEFDDQGQDAASKSNATRELDDLMASLSEFNMKPMAPDQQQQPASFAEMAPRPVAQEQHVTNDPTYAVSSKVVTRTVTTTQRVESPGLSRDGSVTRFETPVRSLVPDVQSVHSSNYANVTVDRPVDTGHARGNESGYANATDHGDGGRKDKLDDMLGQLDTDMQRQGVTTVQKGHCAACNKPIVGQVITALGKIWHPEHFCCAHCQSELGTMTFFERDGQPYCEEDYHALFSPRCAGCNGPIMDRCVTGLGQTWHPEHFCCAHCGRAFDDEGYHEKEGKPYCREDYFDMFAPKCGGCLQPIIDNYISALNKHWHPECFICQDCHMPFSGGSFFEHEGLPFCETHYHAKRGSLCAGCQKPITGRCITAMYRKFHPEHFVCAFCLKQLNKGTFKEQNDKPYCHGCFVKLFG